MKARKMKAFSVPASWVKQAFGPFAEAGEPQAERLVSQIGESDVVQVTAPDLVRELVVIAELYWSPEEGIDAQRFAHYAGEVIKRGRAWLRKLEAQS